MSVVKIKNEIIAAINLKIGARVTIRSIVEAVGQIVSTLKRPRVGNFQVEFADGYYIERQVGEERIGVIDIGVEDYEFAQKVCDALNLFDALGGFDERIVQDENALAVHRYSA